VSDANDAGTASRRQSYHIGSIKRKEHKTSRSGTQTAILYHEAKEPPLNNTKHTFNDITRYCAQSQWQVTSKSVSSFSTSQNTSACVANALVQENTGGQDAPAHAECVRQVREYIGF
jgi:hypothetical protein